MTEIRFTRDYRGKLTQELFYEAGTVAKFDHGAASQIVAEGAAELIEKPKPEPTPSRSARKRTTRSASK